MEIWWFDDGAASPELHQIGDVQIFEDPETFESPPVAPFAAQSGTNVTYLFLFRAFDNAVESVPPIRVGAWSMTNQTALLMDTSNVYPWLPDHDILEAGGIAVRPKISPGAGTGWH